MSSNIPDKQLPTLAVPLGNLDAYIAWANTIPMLSLQEEQDLTQKFYHEQCVDAARRIITAHLRFAIKIAKGFQGYKLPLGDLIQEGTIGLMKALKRFDPMKGVRFVTFALHWVKSEINNFIVQNVGAVKIATTKAQRKLFFKLRGEKKDAQNSFTEKELEALSEQYNVDCDVVREMEKRFDTLDQQSYDSVLCGEHREDGKSLTLEDGRYAPHQLIEHQDYESNQVRVLHQAIAELDERSQAIVKARTLSEKPQKTLTELAQEYGVSPERIRQIHDQALKKIEKSIIGGTKE